MMWGVDDLQVRFGRRLALDHVSIDISPGAITAVVGGDGAGKSTLLRTVVGSVRPSAGRVRRPPKVRTGYVSAGPEGPGVYSDLTVDENLFFAAGAYGVSSAELGERADRLIASAGLGEARARLVGQLSGGMRQKLALICALVHQPDLVVLDEATTGVDPVSRAELWQLLSHGAAGGMAVLLATTYLDEAERAAHVVVLEEGRVLLSGSPDDVAAAMPGVLVEADRPGAGDGARSWSRGRRFRIWRPDGRVEDGEQRRRPRLEDAVIAASLDDTRSQS